MSLARPIVMCRQHILENLVIFNDRTLGEFSVVKMEAEHL